MNSVQSFKELYEILKDEDGLDTLKSVLKEWEYDFEQVQEDVNEDEELKDKIPIQLYNKMKALINGDNNEEKQIENNEQQIENINNNQYLDKELLVFDEKGNLIQNEQFISWKSNKHKLPMLLQAIKSMISNQNALTIIINKLQQMKDEEFDFEGIKDDIEDKDSSDMYTYLQQHNINDSMYNEYCNIVNHVADGTMDKLIQTAGNNNNNTTQQPIVTEPTEHAEHSESHKKWDQVLSELKTYSSFNHKMYETAVNKYKEEDYELDDVEKEEYEESDIIKDLFLGILSDKQHQELHSLIRQAIRSITKPTIYPTIITPMATIQNSYKIEDDEKINPENLMISSEFVDKQNGKTFLYMHKIKEQIEKLHIEQPGDKIESKKDLDQSLTFLFCIFGPNSVQEMVDLIICQSCIAFNNNTYENKKNHLMVIQSERFKQCFNQFIQNNFKYRNYQKSKFYVYMQGLAVMQVTRFLGYGKFSQIISELDNPKRKEINNFEDTDDDDDAHYDKKLDECKSRASDDYYIYFAAKPIQMYSLAFIIGLSRYLWSHKCTGISNCAVVLDLKIPNYVTGYNQEEPATLLYKTFNNQMDNLVGKFTKLFLLKGGESDEFHDNMTKGNIACWSMDLSKPPNERIQMPYYIGRDVNELGSGNEINDENYMEHYDGIHLFWLMRMKRIFTGKDIYDKKIRAKSTRIGIAMHKFQQTIKLYMHYEGGVIRFQVGDIGKWFKDLFRFHVNELNQTNWNIVERYLQEMLMDNQNLEQLRVKPNVNLWKQHKTNKWTRLDWQFYIRNLALGKQVVEKINDIKKYSNAYPK